MNSQQIFPEPHRFKEMFRNRKITLWMLRNLTGVVESQLSRYFNGIDPMPAHLDNSLNRLLFALDGKSNEWERIQEIAQEAVRRMGDMEKNDEALMHEKIEQKSKEGES